MNQQPSVLEWNENREVVALIFGWAGAQDKNLKKYADLYKEHGISTLRYTACYQGAGKSIYGLHSSDGAIEALLADFCSVWKRKEVQFIIQCMSMNGTMAMVSLIRREEFPDLFNRTIGIVFDSCPIYADSWDGYSQVLDFQIGDHFGNSLFGLFSKKLAIWLMVQKQGYNYYEMKFKNVMLGYELKDMMHYYFLREHPNIPMKQLYLYSDADVICDSRQIQQFHETHLRQGKDVTFKNFIDSKHVEHHRKYPKEYTKILDDFLTSLLKKNTSKL
ncbi:unnamed protein product, partial [Mesorhabditis belari]|uniref:Uncharacterized protein n=1 Tax=Mesorhabditis belari TaxID=2138241 RepID=A0AAF3FKX2_9BILA